MDKLVQDFIQNRSQKKREEIVQQWLSDHIGQKPALFVDSLKTMTDRKIFMDIYSQYKNDSGFLEYIGMSTQSAGVDLELKRHTDRLMKRILTKKRKGRTFEEIVHEKLIPLVQGGEWLLVGMILKRLRSIDQKSPLNKAYSRFVAELSAAFEFFKQLVTKNLSDDVLRHLEEFLNHHGIGILPFVRDFFEADPFLSLDLLGKYQFADAEDLPGNIESPEQALPEARNSGELHRQITEFDEINPEQAECLLRSFWRLGAPIIEKIYYSIKFPSAREMLLDFLEKLLSPYGLVKLNQIRDHLERKNRHQNLNLDEWDGPAKILLVLFNEKLSWTEKYKLIFKINEIEGADIKYILKMIKEKIYPLENKEVVGILDLWDSCQNTRELINIPKNFNLRLKKKLDDLANQLVQYIQRESHQWPDEIKLLYQKLLTRVNEQNALEVEWFLELLPFFWDSKGPRYFLKVINFFIHYHIIVDLKQAASGVEDFIAYFIESEELPFKIEDCNKSMLSAHRRFREAGSHARESLQRIVCNLKKELVLRRVLLADQKVELSEDSPLQGFYWHQDNKLIDFIQRDDAGNRTHVFKIKADLFFDFLVQARENPSFRKDKSSLGLIYQEACLDRIQEMLENLEAQAAFFEEYEKLPSEEELLLRNETELPRGYIETVQDLIHRVDGILGQIEARKANLETGQQDLEEELSFWLQKRKEIQAHFSLSYHRLGLSNYHSLVKQLNLYQEEEAVPFIEREIHRLDDPLEKSRLAVQFLQHSHEETVVAKAREIIQQQGVQRYRFLSLFYQILDLREDPLDKIRLIDEFSFYLQKNIPEAFDELAYLLDVQRQRAVAERNKWKNKISELWDLLRGCQKNQERLRLLDQVLEENPSEMFARYIRQIQRSLLGEAIGSLLGTSKALAFDFQAPALEFLMTFRNKDFADKSNHEKLSAHRRALKIQGRFYRLKQENLNRESFERLVGLKKRPGYLNQWLNAEAKFKELKYIGRQLDRTKLSASAKEGLVKYYKGFPDPAVYTGKIESLAQAVEYFGKARNYDEMELCSKIGHVCSEKGTADALEMIKQQVFLESAQKRDVGRLSRLVSSLKDLPTLAKEKEISKALDEHLESMGSFILNRAAEEQQDLPQQAAEAFKEKYEKSTEVENPASVINSRSKNPNTQRGAGPLKEPGESATGPKQKKSSVSLNDRVVKIKQNHDQDYLKAAQDYLQAFRPVITGYIKNLYQKKNDFYTLVDGERRYFQDASLKQAFIKMLAKDVKGKKHQKLIDSLKRDQDLFFMLVDDLFEEKRTSTGFHYYLPNFLE